jgi:chemotaxis protein MotB
MARKKKHEEHVNSEAWAIPYGDLVTLLFALFTVMYAMSSVNEGKFRVLSDSMIAAFHGAPKSMQPINIGAKQAGKGGDKPLVGVSPTALMKIKSLSTGGDLTPRDPVVGKGFAHEDLPGALIRMERQVQNAMQALIDAKLVTVRRENMWLEIEINTDILFPSGAGAFAAQAEPVLDKLAEVLKPFPNPIRVEGHTDNRPIRTSAFPSNWELSAARAASVVHQFMKQGIDPLRLEIVGFGEFHPRQANDSADGNGQTPRTMPPDVELADGSTAGNRLLSRVPVADIDKTVLVKAQAGPAPRTTPGEPMAQYMGPAELAWPAVKPQTGARVPTHE